MIVLAQDVGNVMNSRSQRSRRQLAHEIVTEIMRRPQASTPFELQRRYGLTQRQARAIDDLAPRHFGPGGRGYDAYVRRVERILLAQSARRDNGGERTGPGYAEIQAAMRRYVRRVYGSDVEVDNAVPSSAVGPGTGPGRGIWEAYARYPNSRWFKVKVEHRKLFPPD